MAYALTIAADNETADPLRDLCAEAASLEDAPSMAALGYPPHITLAVYEEQPVADWGVTSRRVTGHTPALSLTFTGVQIFEGAPLVLWAAPEPCSALARLHQAVHALIDPALCREHYRPDRWVVHCSIATAVPARNCSAALAFAARPFQPFIVRFDRADWVRFPPPVILQSHGLQMPKK